MAAKTCPVGSTIIAVDLLPIKAVRGVKTLIGDITTQECRHMIKKETKGDLIDVVLCDGAPNVGGAWSSEAYTQSELVLEAARMASDVLAPGGTFVSKVFRSKDYSALIYALKQLFKKVEATKPAASRNTSAEIFVVCLGYKAPSKIDPRLFDSKYIFTDFSEAPKIEGPDALLRAKDKQRRFREGYEEGISTTHKELGADEFIRGDGAVEMLGKFTKISFGAGSTGTGTAADDEEGEDEEAAVIRSVLEAHKATTSEIRSLCADLQVLGRSEFKQLLRWRLAIKKEVDRVMKERRKAQGEGPDAHEGEEDEDDEEEQKKSQEDRLMEEMESVKTRMEKKLKREKKKRREQKLNARIRSAQLAQAEGIGEDQMDGPESLFSLKGIKGKIKRVSDVGAPDESESESESEVDESESEEDSDLDERRRKYDEMMDEYLESNYKEYKIRQRMTAGGALRKKRSRLGDEGELASEDDEAGQGEMRDDTGSESSDESKLVSQSDGDTEEEQGNELLMDLDANKGITPVDTWFDQDVFAGNMGGDDTGDLSDSSDSSDLSDADNEHEQAEWGDTAAGINESEAASDSDDSHDSYDETGVLETGAHANGAGMSRETNKAGDFEEVPMSEDDSDSAAEEFDMLTDDAKAEVLALAKKFISKKSKSELLVRVDRLPCPWPPHPPIPTHPPLARALSTLTRRSTDLPDTQESSYNRYSFHENDKDLPGWFREDEKRFRRPAYQVTGAEFNEAKQSLAGINTRTTKKVVEAKARKMRRLQNKLQTARKQAEAVAAHEDLSGASKMRQIEKIYAQARSAGGKKKKLSRSAEYKDRKRRPKLDARLRADKRGLKAAEARNKKKRKGRR